MSEPSATLRDQAFNQHAPIWWDNTAVIIVETAAFLLLVFTYFYIRHNFSAWPPPPAPLPELRIPTVNLLLLAASAAPFWNAARNARLHARPVIVGFWLALGVLLGAVAIVLRGFEFPALHARFGSSAYATFKNPWAMARAACDAVDEFRCGGA